jgi:hypothetical protein
MNIGYQRGIIEKCERRLSRKLRTFLRNSSKEDGPSLRELGVLVRNEMSLSQSEPFLHLPSDAPESPDYSTSGGRGKVSRTISHPIGQSI